MPEIVDIKAGDNIFLHGLEYGTIIVKSIDGESVAHEDEFYCLAQNRDKIIERLRAANLLNLEPQQNDTGREN